MNSAEHIATKACEILKFRDEADACGLTKALTPQLNNPVLAAGFALPTSEGPGAKGIKFTAGHAVPFARAWRPGWSHLRKAIP
jgi:hypothetical protein